MKEDTLTVLRAWGLQHHAPRFLSSADGLAVVAHLCNAAAKFICSSFYDLKPHLVETAANTHPFAWQRDGIVYIETCVGQVSFHIFEDIDLSCVPTRAAPWAGGKRMQDNAYGVALAFLGVEDHTFDRWLAREQPSEEEE